MQKILRSTGCAGRNPAEATGESPDDLLRRHSLASIASEAGVPMALRKSPLIRPDDQRHMRKVGSDRSQMTIQQQLTRRGR